MDNVGGGIVHYVSVGSPDVSGTTGGPIAAFSLVAYERADGTVSGQWQDSWGEGGGIHVAVDCLVVDGNTAVVGGVITHSAGSQVYQVGRHAVTAVADNGKSANDPPDQISRSWIGGCGVPFANFPLFDLFGGQVTVR